MLPTRETKEIMNISGAQPSSCSCDKCKAMCHKAPCLGTPADILNLINAGHLASLKGTIWAINSLIGMVQLTQKPDGSCIMLSAEGLCKLHDSGLKPTEGVLTTNHRHDSYRLQVIQGRPSVNETVARTWLNPANAEIMQEIIDKMGL